MDEKFYNDVVKQAKAIGYATALSDLLTALTAKEFDGFIVTKDVVDEVVGELMHK